MDWRLYILTSGKRFTYYSLSSKSEAIDKLLVLERRHKAGCQFEIEPVIF